MDFPVLSFRKFTNLVLIVLTAFSAPVGFVSEASAGVFVQNKGNLGVIKGVVRDEAGNPIAEATVSIFRVGTSRLLKQVRAAADGSFLTKILPGTYTVLAIAQGFNAVTLEEVEVSRSAELVYRFKLERAGGGNTLPEKRIDRNNSKWRVRAAQNQRSIYQNQEGDAPIVENTSARNDSVEEIEESADESEDKREKTKRQSQSAVETYFAGSVQGNYTGINFATLQSLTENAEIIFVGQIGTNRNAPQRFETNVKFRPNTNHQIRARGAMARLGKIKSNNEDKSLGQISFQALDEWRVRNNVILVLGFDYSRFINAGDDSSFSPRFGLQFDVNSKTRARAAYTTATEERTWQNVVEMEGASVLFREPAAIQDFVIENEKPQMARNARLEFGIERVLDNKSSVEANVFFDTVSNRGVGLASFSLNSLNGDGLLEFVGNQDGAARGMRIVYSRRLNGVFSTSAGYAFGNGQKLSLEAVSNPANVFEDGFFQTFYGQFDADFKTGTHVKTIFRFSPQAAIFAIDPFLGRLAIYDPSLSILVTQSLPTLGLPFRAEAIVDARNLFDFQTGAAGEEGSLRLNSGRRSVRGGILVRF